MPSVRLSLSKFVAEYRNERSRHIWRGAAVLQQGFMGGEGETTKVSPRFWACTALIFCLPIDPLHS